MIRSGVIFDGLQCNQLEKQLIEVSLRSLMKIWVTLPLPTILIFYNKIKIGTIRILCPFGNHSYCNLGENKLLE